MSAAPLQHETALPQPPQPEMPIVAAGSLYVGEQRSVFQQGRDHASPISWRTSFTPSTIDLSFRREAQRAVWLSPQSGANARRSAGANFKQRRTRTATSSGVSM